MLRSEINMSIEAAISLLWDTGVALPPFAHWTPTDWASKDGTCDQIRDGRLGWDITDFGAGDFEQSGLLTFTARNGGVGSLEPGKVYAEKWMVILEKQSTPMHHHLAKTEDIICRSGGKLLIRVNNRCEDGELDHDGCVEVERDGVRETVPAGHIFRLEHGESITLPPRIYHEFWAEEGHGTVIAQSISSLNDDTSDNFFFEKLDRQLRVSEDVPAKYLLCTEYPPAGERNGSGDDSENA